MRVCETCHTPYRSNIDFCGLDGTRLEDRDGDGLKGVVIDRYTLVERLGGGGMAAVYKAQHETLDRTVAIKLLYGELASNKEFAERFRREAQASSKIKHKNVVEVIDFGTTPQGASFLIMELLRGHTLGTALSVAGTFSPSRAARVMRDVACGLAAAHDKGFVHRDLKPGNIMLVEENGEEVAKLVDFGLVGGDGPVQASQEKLTQSGVTMGTPHYMAPEQIAGMGCTAQSDLYSLGVVLHELLTGSAPFHGSLGEILVQHASNAPPKLPSSAGLEKIAARLMEKEPRRRPRDAWELLSLIDETGLAPPSPSSSGKMPVGRPSAASASPIDELMNALGPSSPTETALKARLPPSSSASPSASSSKGAVVALGLIVVGAVAAAVVVANSAGRSDASDAGVHDVVKAAQQTQDAVANAALAAARALVVVDAGVTVDREGAAAVVKAAVKDVDAALAARGFDRDDADRVKGVRAALDEFDAAVAANDAGRVGAAKDAVVTAVAGARIDNGLLRKKIERLEKKSKSKKAKRTLQQVKKELDQRLSEAERGQLLLRLAALEREL